MAESVAQCIVGGLIGTGLGFLVAMLLRTNTPFPASVQTGGRDGRDPEFGGCLFFESIQRCVLRDWIRSSR